MAKTKVFSLAKVDKLLAPMTRIATQFVQKNCPTFSDHLIHTIIRLCYLLVSKQKPCGCISANTPGGRPVLIIMAIGEQPAQFVHQQFLTWHCNQEQELGINDNQEAD